MSRPLVPGLLVEGASDEDFLKIVVYRQLQELVAVSARCVVDVERPELADCRTIREAARVAEAVHELSADCHLVFVHNDHRERRKADRVVDRATTSGIDVPVVPLVPIRETEAWMLADRGPWERLPGSNPLALPARPRDVQKIADPKAELDSVLPRSMPQPRNFYFEYIGENVDLAVLARIPAYEQWVAETEVR